MQLRHRSSVTGLRDIRLKNVRSESGNMSRLQRAHANGCRAHRPGVGENLPGRCWAGQRNFKVETRPLAPANRAGLRLWRMRLLDLSLCTLETPSPARGASLVRPRGRETYDSTGAGRHGILLITLEKRYYRSNERGIKESSPAQNPDSRQKERAFVWPKPASTMIRRRMNAISSDVVSCRSP